MIELKEVSKSYGAANVLTNISLTVEPGEFVCITGPSGAGKSTLLHLLTGAEQVDSGTIEIDGVDLRIVPPRALQIFRQRLGIVFQDYKLLKNLTVAENIAFPLEVCGIDDAQIERTVRAVLDRMELEAQANTLPNVLSGGQKARTAIGRAVAHDPLILLADEPTGNIDPDQSAIIMQLFKEINASGTTVIIATHDTGLVDALQTRVVELRDGNIARDSKGGYSAAKAPLKKVVSAATDKKKVKITALRS
ncbi:MAG: ATP-binding cassette domain-containing protein [Candidatus Peribacter sp.]|jgi:cell division transport system ATP-binding protein|nr:ATP-binding cassette domain-containing protein [Candidatus Peribacter sp.]MBT4392943.1 ATP-binding cassette domain-containing protein [Candidatus Peribacter sp.]MBT4601003.1 ATP-binding cassette domain-containing protein [Candidatus Peribacter sp.]MBT5149045.1 ATP-binding cassette domain-containing protein [Candidatus Peribacter sp.]MBT5637369.1 ATP-binding cassette domain-containing protein [Candidatus Peribacter sp.]